MGHEIQHKEMLHNEHETEIKLHMYFYQLDQHILEQVKTNPYLGLNIS
jgi:hypothetical protein